MGDKRGRRKILWERLDSEREGTRQKHKKREGQGKHYGYSIKRDVERQIQMAVCKREKGRVRERKREREYNRERAIERK